MISQRFTDKVRGYTQTLQRYIDRLWYPPLLGALAVLDFFVVFIPTDGILVSSCMLKPRRWLGFAFSIAAGSTVGALLLAAVVELHGLPWIMELYPGIVETKMWAWTLMFFNDYGLLLVFAVAATPLMQQPTVILASAAHTPWTHLALAIFAGRIIKYLIMGYLASYAPSLVTRLWGIKRELKNGGVKGMPIE